MVNCTPFSSYLQNNTTNNKSSFDQYCPRTYNQFSPLIGSGNALALLVTSLSQVPLYPTTRLFVNVYVLRCCDALRE